MIAIELKQALQESGCPICRLRSTAESRYIRSLLRESINDSITRGHIISSLGYCPEHVWQTGLLEAEHYGVPLGNVIVYNHLADVVQTRLKVYARRVQTWRQSAWKRWMSWLLPRRFSFPKPEELQPKTRCRVCQNGEQSERANLHWLMEGLSEKQNYHDLYAASDGICLPHLRLALEMADSRHAAAAEFLAESTIRRLSILRHNLVEFERKNTWDYRDEEQSKDERDAWLRALAFFGGSVSRNDHHKA
jgi:hypothetical protein